jgi:predicted Ser/Thr protein kinase
MTKLQRLTRDPEASFDSPREVIERKDLSNREKIVVLESWQADLIETQKAVEENMTSEMLEPGETAAKLAQVIAAIGRVRQEQKTGS